MDLQTLSNLFASTLNPDPNARRAAELDILKVGNEPGMIGGLLQIIGADSIDISTRQSCSVWLKNRVHGTYSIDPATRRPNQPSITEPDREALRANILPLLAASPSRSITVQLANSLKDIVAHDLPNARWPGLIDAIKQLLVSGDIRHVQAGCVASLEVVRAFRFRQKADVLPPLVAQLFPTLVGIATQMMQTPPSAAQEIPAMLHLILKTYKTSIVVNLSAHQQSAESIVPWGQLLFGVVNLQIPKEAVPEDEDDRERSEWWRAKKWAYATLGRLFHRFGNPSQLPSTMQAEYAGFAQHFVTVFAPEILAIYLRQVELYVSGTAWLSKKCQYQIFTFFTECIKPKSTWTLLKPHAQTLVESFVFPQLSFNASREQLWESDPIEYVRMNVDESESFSTPVSAATTFLFSLASNRTKTTFMPILGFVNGVLRSENASSSQKFGALNMTAALGPWIMRHPDVSPNMEQFVLQFVTPNFTRPEAYLRAIACEVVGTVTKDGLSFSSEENLNVNFRAIAAALDDPDFVVRVQAALALTELIILHDSDLLKLADETDLDILNRSMEVMVNAFQTELLPVAAQLTARLCESYMRLIKESLAAPEQPELGNISFDALNNMDDDKTYAAMGFAKTISTVISAVDSSQEILAQVQEVIIPIITFTLENKILDLFDNMYELVDSLTFKLRSISPNLWPVFELTYNLFKSDAVDFLQEMLPSLDNFVSYGSDVIKARPEYQSMLVDIFTTSMSPGQPPENRLNGCKLAESILLNLRGSVDNALQTMITVAFNQVDKFDTAALRLANLEVLVNAVLYNPAATLHIMETTHAGSARVFFDKWFDTVADHAKMPRVHDKKLAIVAMCALLEMTPEQVPDSVKEGWPGIVGGVLKIFKDLPGAITARKELEDQDDEDDDDDIYEEKVLNMNEDDEDVWDEDSAYLEMLANEVCPLSYGLLLDANLAASPKGARLRARTERKETGEEDSDDEEDEITEELGYFSTIDAVNPYVSFKRALTTFQMQNPSAYQTATTSLNVDQQTVLMEVMRIAEQAGAPAA
ncbi:Importin N-terminal domain-containing protein [Mycena indigotica]|uniref:Importin N-terminal domain-containing protein n=1 Tax=Mycena indigotica TaxID=2126181 RepID=A0A8H6SIU9_9AGAR|nr:Importin N-terminal domain-containing protein [Mycena indigotica]KAF7298645.1 Importin N-terminal domain-containing protein [Mycena indigotica]